MVDTIVHWGGLVSQQRATVVIVTILVLVAVALLAFGTWAVLNGETGAGAGAGPTGELVGQRAAATNAFE
jgi:hypothetical protein